MFDFSGKVAVVTGGTKGIGAGIAEMFAQNGAAVVVVSRTILECEKKAEDLTAKYGVPAYGHRCDVSSVSSVKNLVEDVVERYGHIDILVNNAGTAVTKPALELTEEDWDRVINTNLKGVFLLCQGVGRQMVRQGYGKIVNVASMFGLVGDKNILPYISSKGGVLQLTRGLALEWAKHNIQVNAVAPGYVITGMNSKELGDEKIQKYIFSKTPMRRYGEAHEIAGTVLYLSSDEASFVTGAVYSVDGGWTAQ